jgi:CBS domain containing-hemolysin-like protein
VSVWPLVGAALLLLANGFFVALEFAVIASRRTKLETLAEEGNARARAALGVVSELSLQLAGMQLGITMASLALGLVAEPATAHLLESALEPLGLPSGLVHSLAFVIGLSIVVLLHMVVGEMVPKNIAMADPERTLMWLAIPDRIYVGLFRPVIHALNLTANAGTRLLGVEPRDELATAHTADELAEMLGASRHEGLIEEFEHRLLTGALDLARRPVSTVMVPRERIVSVGRTVPASEAEHAVVESGHSRLLVVGDDLDDVFGYVHVKDLLTLAPAARARPLPLRRIRRMLVIPPTQSLEDVLGLMRRARVHMAVVVDHGTTVGLVTLDDVLAELVGELAGG